VRVEGRREGRGMRTVKIYGDRSEESSLALAHSARLSYTVTICDETLQIKVTSTTIRTRLQPVPPGWPFFFFFLFSSR